jgi:multidrug efflux pump subunit AcrA (membrane-fusion protein)
VDVLPEDAVVRSGENEFVFVEQSPLHFEMQKVQTGTVSDGFVQILQGSGALKGRKVVIKNAYALLMKKENTADE